LDASDKQSEAALDVTIRNSKLDERPWVGLQDFRCDGCASNTDKPTANGGQLILTITESVTIGNMYGIMENTGKTPAVKMIVNAVWTDRKGSDPIPDYDAIERELQIRNPFKVPEWLPPDEAAKNR